ncbi:MAG: hypothetical protein IKV99_03030 [Oscillospiraceae bacterium]|nr:hypothetical protein [Oscillospiraceae bacterium]
MTTYQPTKRFVTVALVLALLVSLIVTVWGDTGPKPSVRVSFENMDDVLCYGTLLSEQRSTGPASAWDGDPAHAQHNGMEGYEYQVLDEAVWQKFVDYADADGYYFLQEGWLVTEEEGIAWTYYPPNPFKILLYFPGTDTFVTSGIYERYAFDSYFTVDMNAVDESGLLPVRRDYNGGVEVLSLLARIVITIAVELAVAWAFGFRERKQLRLLLWMNVGTQVLLNVLLNLIAFHRGPWAYVACYVLFELVVFVLEAVVYAVCMRRISERAKRAWVCVVYALVANVLSFVVGYNLSLLLPGLF